jgi:hypothetical protein
MGHDSTGMKIKEGLMPGEKQKENKTPPEWSERRPERTREEGTPRERQEQGKAQRRSEETTRKQ